MEIIKNIWYIDDKLYTLKKGYVKYNYNEYAYVNVYEDKECLNVLDWTPTANIFNNKKIAINIFKGMIHIKRENNFKEMERLRKENEELIEKILQLK